MKKPIKIRLVDLIDGYSDIAYWRTAKAGESCLRSDGDVYLSSGTLGNTSIVLTPNNKKYDASKGEDRAHIGRFRAVDQPSKKYKPVDCWVPVVGSKCPFHKEASIVSIMLKTGKTLNDIKASDVDFNSVVACKFEQCAEGWEL